ncbi:MAG: UbiA family prenyltransferase [Desulfobacterales bacterium]|nr:UbiA family prenyltransferase [Desulfobacterales bacterium]
MLDNPSIQHDTAVFSSYKLFLGLSRTPHALLDMSTPALGALLWLGDFPPIKIILLGLMTVMAGYTAVYALNDVIDYQVDREKVLRDGFPETEYDLDAVWIRHPIAHGLLSFKQGIFWTTGWMMVALTGAFLLRPVCVLIFLAGCGLEIAYCLLLKITCLRAFVSGGVKASGAVAAVFAVDPNPSLLFILVMFLWLFCWEIGGQNIPNDWSDVEQDRHLMAKTIPVRLGPQRSIEMILIFLTLTLVFHVGLFYITRTFFTFYYVLASLAAGLFLFMVPALRLNTTKARAQAIALFNRSSYYPLTLLVLTVVKIITR